MIYDIACYGDSLTSGWHSRDWTTIILSELSIGSQHNFRIYNLGRSGARSQWGAQNVDVLTALKPNIATVQFAINDAYTTSNVTVGQFKTNITNIVSRIRDDSPDTAVILMTMNPLVGAQALNAPNLADYYNAVLDVADSQGIFSLDHYSAWLSAAPTTNDIPDGVHPSLAALKNVFIPPMVQALRSFIE